MDLNDNVALNAAKLSLDHKLSMADGMMLATAHLINRFIWTQGADFKGIKK